MQSHLKEAWPLSLRFRNKDVEQAYLQSKRPVLVYRLKWLLLIVVLILAAKLLLRRDHFVLATALESLAITREAEIVYLSLLFSTALLAAVGIAALHAKQGRLFGSRTIEAATVAGVIALMAAVLCCSPKRYVKMRGYELWEVFGNPYDSDSGLLLLLDACITATHLGLPIRWHMMLPMEATAMLLYIVHLSLIGSEEGQQGISNCVLMAALVLTSSVGKRSADMEDRRAFLSVISEKALRCEAEFQLSQARPSPPPRAQSEGRSSEHMTDRSGAIFEAAALEVEGTPLAMVAAKGELEHWRIAASEVKLLMEEPLGRGSFGSVKRGVFCGMLVAVKSPHLEPGDVKVPELCNELRVLRHLRHPHIVTVYGAVVLPQEHQISLVLELIEGPSLKAFLAPEGSGSPSVSNRFEVMLGVCHALLYMHSRKPPIVHGDLKGSNVMVEVSQGRAFPKVLDFGLSRVVNSKARALGGTLAWVAPEVLESAPVRCSADTYSFARLLAYTATSIPPMRNMTKRAIIRALRTAPHEATWPSDCAFAGLKPMVSACLRRRQEERPSVAEVHEALLGMASDLFPKDDRHFLHMQAVTQPASTSLTSTASPGTGGSLPSLPEEAAAPATPEARAATPKERTCLPFRELPGTSQAALEASLIDTFKRWNTADLRAGCCELHSWCRLGQQVLEGILATGCVPVPLHESLPQDSRQCPFCGIMRVSGAACDICGGQLDEPSQLDKSSQLHRSGQLDKSSQLDESRRVHL